MRQALNLRAGEEAPPELKLLSEKEEVVCTAEGLESQTSVHVLLLSLAGRTT